MIQFQNKSFQKKAVDPNILIPQEEKTKKKAYFCPLKFTGIR